jgi:NADP-dependent 3-hydroxy acid dehydrogenase YdfG
MPQPISHKAWFITGASKGFGYVWTQAALARGDSVAAAARNIGSLDALKVKYGDRLLPLTLDVGSKGAVDAAVEQAHKQLGHIDVAINNAGYGVFETIEKVSPIVEPAPHLRKRTPSRVTVAHPNQKNDNNWSAS